MTDDNDYGSLLVVVIDTNVSPRVASFKDECIMPKCLDAAIVFANSHLMMDPMNKLAIIGCHTQQSAFLYPPSKYDVPSPDSSDGQYELFSFIKNSVKYNIKKLILESPATSDYIESIVAGAITMALCYIHRLRKEQVSTQKMPARIFVLSASGESASQYMDFMNVFFTAQKEDVQIDACVIEKDSGLLQQGCDITGGLYLKIMNTAPLLQYISWVFLPDDVTRKKFILPSKVHVDFRAACFCHRTLIEIGYVCSVCLSIFCTFTPICSTCQTTFKLGPIPTTMTRKRKKQSSYISHETH